MKIDRILKWFFPKEERFFELFDKSADAVERAAKELTKLNGVSRWDELPELADRIHAIEHEGDEITHEIMSRLHSTFVTPIERADIVDLAKALDQILDLIDDVARRIKIYKTAPIPKGFSELALIIHEGALLVRQGTSLLRDLSKADEVRSLVRQIYEVEKRGDAAYYRCLEDIYREKDALRIMQLKELLEDFEAAVDGCENAANVFENIILQNG